MGRNEFVSLERLYCIYSALNCDDVDIVFLSVSTENCSLQVRKWNTNYPQTYLLKSYSVIGGDRVRQADSTIRGYLYQFNKSILEILNLTDGNSLVLEGIIEDIDILSPASTTTIQCKYHEDKKYTISSVAVPIIEMLCNYCETSYVGKDIHYILYAFFADNVDCIEVSDFCGFLNTTQDKEILTKYFHRIFTIPDATILKISNKAKKTASDKEAIVSYYKTHRSSLSPRVSVDTFWSHFSYVKAEKYDRLKELVLEELSKITDKETALTLYYPNAFSYVASLSAKTSYRERTVSKEDFIRFLKQQKTILLNRWTLQAIDRKALLKAKRESLASFFASNPDMRAFVFSDDFLKNNSETIIPFIREYLGKYFRKPKLQKPPIFVFGDKKIDLMQNVIIELYKYQQPVNTGMVGMQFVDDSFINDNNCPHNYVCKISQLCNISTDVLERCHVNQLFIVGSIDMSLESKNYFTELLAVSTTDELRYLVGVSRTLEA